MKFIVDLYLDGYEDKDEMKQDCIEFIQEALDFSASSVSVESTDDLVLKFDKFVDFCIQHGKYLMNHEELGEMVQEIRSKLQDES